MYFPHAFCKILVGSQSTVFRNGNGTLTGADLLAGQLGLLDANNRLLLDINPGTPTYVANPMFHLAQGSFYANDVLGGSFHGGYQESVKSKGINPKYVSEFFKILPTDAQNNVVQVTTGVDATCIECNTTYYLRLDVKGSPALRTLTHNAYLTVPAFSGCCDDDNSNIDPNYINLLWADFINQHPTMNNFIDAQAFNIGFTSTTADYLTSADIVDIPDAERATLLALANNGVGALVVGTDIPPYTKVVSVGALGSGTAPAHTAVVIDKTPTANGNNQTVKFYEEIESSTYVVETGVAADTNDGLLILESAYVDTSFLDCSFNPQDHYELEPLQIFASITDESGDPCNELCHTISELQVAHQGKGYGETVLRDLILAKRYRQEDFKEDPRLREVIGDTALTEISRTTKYVCYGILHSIPRKSNPSGTLDNDQYLIKLAIPEAVYTADVGGTISLFETWFDALLNSASNEAVQLRVEL